MNYFLNKVENIRRKLQLSPFPGHYSSPIVDPREIIKREKEIFTIRSKDIPGIDLNEDGQLRLLDLFETYYHDIPFQDTQSDLRYYYNNGYYLHSDAIFLFSMIKHFQPKRIIEIGAGFSSAAMLDTVDVIGLQNIEFTFVEPNPDRLMALLRKEDNARCTILRNDLENVDLSIFGALEENDVLFIDSSHVSKTGSDVNRILFEILPRLKKKVLIHFHDIFFPFEYPRSWVVEWNAFGWNENYLLHAFLMHNKVFDIVFFNTFLEHFYKERFSRMMPKCLLNPGGSIWIQKTC